jgi:hypothetical protein
MKVFQSRIFERKVRRFKKQEKKILDQEIRRILKEPDLGDEKKGDLQGGFVRRFKVNRVRYLLAYRVAESRLELIMIGPHENYYRDPKSYLKAK